ncbi:MAG: citrate lyase subunit alpha [Bacteroidales bacterium]|nr:citrate lyase subunit alpha [Bacteroidales bacterium]
MKNVLGRDIPAEIENYGRVKPYGGAFRLKPENKLLSSLDEAIEKTGLKDGMTISFHHHFRNGDKVVNLVMEAIRRKGIKDIHIAASGLFPCHDVLVPMVEDGTIRKLTFSTIAKGGLTAAIMDGKFREPCVIQSHGARARAILDGDLHIDVAFIAAPCCDTGGNMCGIGGKSNCGLLSFAYADAAFADKVVAVTDGLTSAGVDSVEISHDHVDYVVEVDSIGDSEGIMYGSTVPSDKPEKLRIAEMVALLLDKSGYIKDGMSFQTGASSIGLSVATYVEKVMKEKGVKGSFCLGGITRYLDGMINEGLFEKAQSVQIFDIDVLKTLSKSLNHIAQGSDRYGNPRNPNALVNFLDIMILGATEVDLDFNVNVITSSSGRIITAPGGHTDCAAGAKIAVVVQESIRRGASTICDRVCCITTPGETVDVLVTELGIAVNPLRQDLVKALEGSGLPLMTIGEMKALADAKATAGAGELKTGGRIVAVVEYRDGSVIDVIRQSATE